MNGILEENNILVLNGRIKYFVPQNEIENVVKNLEEICSVVEEIEEEDANEDEGLQIDIETTDGVHTPQTKILEEEDED